MGILIACKGWAPFSLLICSCFITVILKMWNLRRFSPTYIKNSGVISSLMSIFCSNTNFLPLMSKYTWGLIVKPSDTHWNHPPVWSSGTNSVFYNKCFMASLLQWAYFLKYNLKKTKSHQFLDAIPSLVSSCKVKPCMYLLQEHNCSSYELKVVLQL